MKLKLLALASIISTTGVHASVNSCCNEVRDIIGYSSTCDTELNMAKIIGSDYSSYNRQQFGISSATRRLPIPNETHAGNPTRPNSLQNAGYIMTKSQNSPLKSVVPVYKHTDFTGSTCVGLTDNSISASYDRFNNLERIAEQKSLGNIDLNSCLIYIDGLSNVLNLQYTSSLKRELKKSGISLLASHQRSSAKATITLPYLDYANGQQDISFQRKDRRNKILANYNFDISIYYKNSRMTTARQKVTYDISNITDMDLMDYTVLTKAISEGIDVNKCRRSR
jgi:hypothetical protein